MSTNSNFRTWLNLWYFFDNIRPWSWLLSCTTSHWFWQEEYLYMSKASFYSMQCWENLGKNYFNFFFFSFSRRSYVMPLHHTYQQCNNWNIVMWCLINNYWYGLFPSIFYEGSFLDEFQQGSWSGFLFCYYCILVCASSKYYWVVL